MKRSVHLALVWLLATFTFTSFVGIARAADKEQDNDKTATITTLWTPPQDGDAVTLLPKGKSEPVTVKISAATRVAGICIDCYLYQPFRVSDATKICLVCGCNKPNVECLAWKSLKQTTVGDMLRALPPGVALRAIYNEADKPESGLKHLTIDRHTVLLPVTGLSGQTADQLLGLVKSVKGANAQLLNDGKQLLFTLKDYWTTEMEFKFEIALGKAGGKLAYPAPEEASK